MLQIVTTVSALRKNNAYSRHSTIKVDIFEEVSRFPTCQRTLHIFCYFGKLENKRPALLLRGERGGTKQWDMNLESVTFR